MDKWLYDDRFCGPKLHPQAVAKAKRLTKPGQCMPGPGTGLIDEDYKSFVTSEQREKLERGESTYSGYSGNEETSNE